MDTYGNAFQRRMAELRAAPRRWLVTGAAGFIGSNLVEALLLAGQSVVGLDNLTTGKNANIEDVRSRVGDSNFARFAFVEGDIRDAACCAQACKDANFVLHHAALISVPLSLKNPTLTNDINVGGFVCVMEAAKKAGVERMVYASSSAVYGARAEPPNQETQIGEPLSPYALSKYIDELYASFYSQNYDLPCVGLRYFNVFGHRQDPAGAYAAVIPRWVEAMMAGRPCRIFGDGMSTRDFCHVGDVIQANILAATQNGRGGEVFNVGTGRELTLLALHQEMLKALSSHRPDFSNQAPEYDAPRPGDIRRSVADITRIQNTLGFEPTRTFTEALASLFEGPIMTPKAL